MPNTIADNLQRLKNAKTAIGEAIVAKGGTVTSGDGLEEFATDIATIPSGGGVDPEPINEIIEAVNGSLDDSLNGDGDTSLLTTKSITANGTYSAVDDDALGYSSVSVEVENSYGAEDEGKVVYSGALVSQTSSSTNANGVVDTTLIGSLTVEVDNTYTAEDEGKVVSNGALVDQSSSSTNSNGVVDTTLVNSLTVSVPNTYTAGDEGKVVSSGALVSQSSSSTTTNGTVDTTLINSLNVNVANTYVAGDEGKVVYNGALASQSAYPAELKENDTYDTTNYNSVTVNVPSRAYIPGGVNFYDLDGVVLYSYTAEEFAKLTEMPPNPDQTEHWLTAQGWNWSLSDAKTFVAKYGGLNIGQYYVTIDGKTSMKIRLQEGRVHPQLGLYMNGTADIDWGDESEHSTLTGTNFAYKYIDHVYPGAGEYIILITITGKARIAGNGGNSFFCKHTVGSKTAGNESRIYSNSIIDVHLGNDIDIGSYAFFRCYSLEHVTIPNTITTIDGQAFRWCSTLSGIVIPHGVTSIGASAFEGCYSMRYASISKTVTSIGNYAFSQCFGVSSLIFGEGMTSVGDYAFQDTGACDVIKVPGLQNISASFATRNRMLKEFVVPSGVTTIGNGAFNQAYGIESITIPDTVTTIETSAFAECQAMNFIEFSDNVTTLGESMFNNCTSLKAFRIPIHVTTIPKMSFYKCYALDHIEIPDEVTSIGAQAFDTCTGLMYIKFIGRIPPTLANSNSFANITSDCRILVPQDYYETYTSAANYPSPATYKYDMFYTYASGRELPNVVSEEKTYDLTWYASINDLIAESNPITEGNGEEIYARVVERV